MSEEVLNTSLPGVGEGPTTPSEGPITPAEQITAGITTPDAPRREAVESSPETTPLRQDFSNVASDIMGMARHPQTVPRAEEMRPLGHHTGLDSDGGRYDLPPRGRMPRSFCVPDLGIIWHKENYTAAQHARLRGERYIETGDGVFRPMRCFHARVDVRLGIDHWFRPGPVELGQDGEEEGREGGEHELEGRLSSLSMTAIADEDGDERLTGADDQDFSSSAQQPHRSESPASDIYDASPRASVDSTRPRSPPSISSPPTPPNAAGSTVSLSPRSPETRPHASIDSPRTPPAQDNHPSDPFTPIGCISTFPGYTSPPTPPAGFLALHPLQHTTPGQTTTMPRTGFLERPYQPPVPRPEPIPSTFSPDPTTIYPITDENLEAHNSLMYHHSGVPRRDCRRTVVDTRDNSPVTRDLEIPVLLYGEVVWVADLSEEGFGGVTREFGHEKEELTAASVEADGEEGVQLTEAQVEANARAAGLVTLRHEVGGSTLRRALSRLELGSQRAVSRAGAVSRAAVRAASRPGSRMDDMLEQEKPVWTTPATKSPRRLQIAILGASGSGKTAMIERFKTAEFIAVAPTTGVDVTTFSTISSDRPLTLEFWDFSGAPAYTEETAKRLKSGFFHAAVLCFSVEDAAGLAAVEQEWKPLLQRTQIEPPPFLVLGLKKDMFADGSGVLTQRGTRMAARLGAVAFAECSAMTGEAVESALRYLVEAVMGRLDEGQRAIAKGRRREKTKDAVIEAGKNMVKAFSGLFRRWGKGDGSSA
ncbi:hypothetical protein QBC39DRAFT_430275 [Podospora conica]|nr:hypothetical protein QBC39DRAFT_430275 [Schizothecium conicum]